MNTKIWGEENAAVAAVVMLEYFVTIKTFFFFKSIEEMPN